MPGQTAETRLLKMLSDHIFPTVLEVAFVPITIILTVFIAPFASPPYLPNPLLSRPLVPAPSWALVGEGLGSGSQTVMTKPRWAFLLAPAFDRSLPAPCLLFLA